VFFYLSTFWTKNNSCLTFRMILKSRFFSEIFKIIKCLLVIRPIYLERVAAIAAAITAYSRIHMSQFKNNPDINLYYTDTDSIYTDSDVEPSLIDSQVLGKLKLENTCNKAIFLTPKVYCLLTESGELISKVKGLSHDVELTLEDF